MAVRPKDPVLKKKPGLLEQTTVDQPVYNPLTPVSASGGHGGAGVVQPIAPNATGGSASPGGSAYSNLPPGSVTMAAPGSHVGVDILGNPTPVGPRPVSARAKLGAPIGVNDQKATQLVATDINTARDAANAASAAQGKLTPQLQAAAAGAVPSAAQIASRAQLNQQSLAMERAAAAVRGGAPGMYAAQHAVGAALGGVQGGVISQGGAAREAELNRAQAVLSQHLGMTRGGYLATAGNDIATANANANIAQGSQLANQGNALRVGQANLTNEVNAGSLDLNDTIRRQIEAQRHGLVSQEALDQRALGLAGVGLGGVQNDVAAVNAGNAKYLGNKGLEIEGEGLRLDEKGINRGIDAGYFGAVLGGAAVFPALASMPGAPAPAAPAAPAAMAPAYTPTPTYQPTSIAQPALTLAPLPTPQNMYAQYGLGGY